MLILKETHSNEREKKKNKKRRKYGEWYSENNEADWIDTIIVSTRFLELR